MNTSVKNHEFEIMNTFWYLLRLINSNNNKLFNDTARLTTTTPLHHHWLNFYYWRQGTNITTPKQPRSIAAAVTFIPSAITISAVDIYTFTKLSAMTRWRDKLYQSHSDAEDQTENNTSSLTDVRNMKVCLYCMPQCVSESCSHWIKQRMVMVVSLSMSVFYIL